jgi:hypothetical protein
LVILPALASGKATPNSQFHLRGQEKLTYHQVKVGSKDGHSPIMLFDYWRI